MSKYIPGILLLVLTSCAAKNSINEDEMKRIVQVHNQRLEQAFLNQDLDAFNNLYASNARLCPDGDRFYSGTSEILEYWRQDFASTKVTQMSTSTLSVAGNVDTIYETGITQVTSISSGTTHTGTVKYINVWSRQSDNTYKLSIDFWNSTKAGQSNTD